MYKDQQVTVKGRDVMIDEMYRYMELLGIILRDSR